MKKSLVTLQFVILLGFFVPSCCSIWGAHDLGNNLTLLEGDKTEDRAIIYCTSQNGCCRGGLYVIPSVGSQYYMYVEKAESNKDWIIAKSVQVKDNKENYWIISKDFDIKNLDCEINNCDSILQSHVTGPLNLTEFMSKKKALKIDLDF